jgi:hypothetical protein
MPIDVFDQDTMPTLEEFALLGRAGDKIMLNLKNSCNWARMGGIRKQAPEGII